MPKPTKLILVTAEHHPQHKLWVKLVEEVSKEKNLDKEIRKEDYILITEHGDTDDLGMPWLPQLFVELENGNIKLLLSRLPLNDNLQPDINEAKKTILTKLETYHK